MTCPCLAKPCLLWLMVAATPSTGEHLGAPGGCGARTGPAGAVHRPRPHARCHLSHLCCRSCACWCGCAWHCIRQRGWCANRSEQASKANKFSSSWSLGWSNGRHDDRASNGSGSKPSPHLHRHRAPTSKNWGVHTAQASQPSVLATTPRVAAVAPDSLLRVAVNQLLRIAAVS